MNAEAHLERFRTSIAKRAKIPVEERRRRTTAKAVSLARWKERRWVIDAIESVPVRDRTMRAVLSRIVEQIKARQ